MWGFIWLDAGLYPTFEPTWILSMQGSNISFFKPSFPDIVFVAAIAIPFQLDTVGRTTLLKAWSPIFVKLIEL